MGGEGLESGDGVVRLGRCVQLGEDLLGKCLWDSVTSLDGDSET